MRLQCRRRECIVLPKQPKHQENGERVAIVSLAEHTAVIVLSYSTIRKKKFWVVYIAVLCPVSMYILIQIFFHINYLADR